MDAIEHWPRDLLIHFLRLEENFKNVIISYLEKNSDQSSDILERFLLAIEQIDEVQSIIMKNSDFLFLIANVFTIKGDYKKAYEICDKDEFHPGLLNIKAYNLILQRKFDDLEEIIDRAKGLSSSRDPYNEFFAEANLMLHYYYSQKFDLLKSQNENFENKRAEIKKQFKNQENLTSLIDDIYALGKSVIINFYRREGQLEKGIQLGQQLIEELRLVNNRYYLNRIMNNTALCLIESGNLKEGLDLLEECYKFSEIIGNSLQLSIGANNIGFISRTMGDIEQAMKYFYLALDNAKKAKVDPYIVASQTNIAHLHLDFGNPNLALSSSETALESLKNTDVPIPTQIQVSLRLCRADVFEALDRFKDAENTLDQALIDISEANLKKETAKVYLRKSRLAVRQSNLGDASKYLENALVMATENKSFEVIINAKLQLAEIDLLRYRMNTDEALILSALEKIEDSRQLSIEQDYKLIQIDVFILHGLLLSMKNKRKPARKVLEKAIKLAKELNLPEKELEARNQLREIEKEKKSILVKIFSRINQSIRSTLSYESVTKPKKVETELKALLIIAKETGLPFYKKEFSEELQFDSNLVSGLLTAIRTMGQEVLYAEEGGLKLIDHGNVSIMLEITDTCIVALVVSKETYLLREKLRKFSENLMIEPFYKEIDFSIIESDIYRDQQIEKMIKDILLAEG